MIADKEIYMGFIKKLIDKFNKGFFYIVDPETLKGYLIDCAKFSKDYYLEMCEEMNIYFYNEKHHLLLWNYSASENLEEHTKGIVAIYDGDETGTIDELFAYKLTNLPPYFKIELIHGDSVELNKYMSNHPELRIEDY